MRGILKKIQFALIICYLFSLFCCKGEEFSGFIDSDHSNSYRINSQYELHFEFYDSGWIQFLLVDLGLHKDMIAPGNPPYRGRQVSTLVSQEIHADWLSGEESMSISFHYCSNTEEYQICMEYIDKVMSSETPYEYAEGSINLPMGRITLENYGWSFTEEGQPMLRSFDFILELPFEDIPK